MPNEMWYVGPVILPLFIQHYTHGGGHPGIQGHKAANLGVVCCVWPNFLGKRVLNMNLE